MRLEETKHRPLEEDEYILKKAYLNSDKKLWTTPMTYSEYKLYSDEGLIVKTPKSHVFLEHSKNGQGVTVNDTVSPANVTVTLHRRYGYPILHNHDYIEIVYVASGFCEHHLEETHFTMNEGDVCVVAPNAFHTLVCLNDESCILNIMVSKKYFDKNFLAILSGRKLISDFFKQVLYQRISSPYILFPTGDDAWLHELARRLLTEELQQMPSYEYALNRLTSVFLLHLMREYEDAAVVSNMQSAAQNDLIVAILGYLSANYNSTSLAETADYFGYSQAYLSRTIHENLGKTYNTVISELQMEHAAKLLKTTTLSFTEIAQEVGCFDSSHFSKKFKTIYGVTPREYRAKEAEEK